MKKVEEMEFKLFSKYLDALLDENFTLVTIDVEDNNIPESYETEDKSLFRLKSFERNKEGVPYREKVYLKVM